MKFFNKATLETYAGSGEETDSQREGFIELEYKEGPWCYRDSYAGFFESWGQTVIWHDGKPFWTHLYGGGMVPEFHGNAEFAKQTFTFLKKALTAGVQDDFKPRGPDNFKEGDWEYSCEWEGDVKNFKGSEKILFQDKVVFTHDFLGGLIISR
ncbi:MAG: DUF5680 domain-containing protein [Candidatus Aenigmatarchaeota archaeon]